MVLKRMGKWTAVVSLSAVLVSGCGMFGGDQNTSGQIDPPQVTEGEGDSEEVVGDEEATATTTMEQTLYLEDAHGYVVPVTMAIPEHEGRARQVLTYMIKGGPVEDILPEGFSAILPEGTKILGMTVKEGVATVDFSQEFTKYDKSEERKIMDAISRALTEFSNIQKVSVWVKGHPLSEMPVSKLPTNLLTRESGINLELSEHAEPGRTSAVTVFFQGQLDNEKSYFVPVTRLIPKTDNLAKAVVEEFIKGPREESVLSSSMIPTTKVLQIEQKDKLITVNLSSEVLDFNSGKEANPEALEGMVLSLTETTGAEQVQILVEGKPIQAGDSIDFSKPVLRPSQINAIQS